MYIEIFLIYYNINVSEIGMRCRNYMHIKIHCIYKCNILQILHGQLCSCPKHLEDIRDITSRKTAFFSPIFLQSCQCKTHTVGYFMKEGDHGMM